MSYKRWFERKSDEGKGGYLVKHIEAGVSWASKGTLGMKRCPQHRGDALSYTNSLGAGFNGRRRKTGDLSGDGTCGHATVETMEQTPVQGSRILGKHELDLKLVCTMLM
uniref:Uncharacterized protein n=1 Tax=Oryza meridionalis TaxID=40149 RepID=A0A0E0DGL1_9ORYZ